MATSKSIILPETAINVSYTSEFSSNNLHHIQMSVVNEEGGFLNMKMNSRVGETSTTLFLDLESAKEMAKEILRLHGEYLKETEK